MSGDGIIASAEGITRRFGGFVALNNVSVAFERGRLTSIIGPNGAGKSTLFNIVSGALPPTRGRVRFEGRDITGRRQHEYARMSIAKSFQITNLFPYLSVFENARVAVQAMRSRFDIWTPRARMTDIAERAAGLLDLVGLHALRDRPAEDLAHGEQRSLEIAMALACEPRLLLLDEPTAGMSAEETRAMMDLITRLAADRTVILVEHKMKLVMGISDRVIVLHQGELLAEGTPAEIRASDEVRRVYLGQSTR